MQYAVLFLEGIITFISPCMLPMLPVYITYFSGSADSEQDKKGKRTLINALGFVLGFTLVFVLLGALSSTLGAFLFRNAVAINIIFGGVLILLGLNYMGVLKLDFLNRSHGMQVQKKQLTFFQSLLFGILFCAGWTPCIGTFLGSALMIAANSETVFTGILMLLVYSLGLGIPFVLSALLIGQLKGAFAFIKRNYKVINIISGALLVILGLLMMTGKLGF